MEQSVPRSISEKFPVRCLLIDVSTPWTSELSNNVSTALSHLFALVTNTAGVNRIPSISIFVIGKQVECIFPLQVVKGNHSKLLRSIQELKMHRGHDVLRDQYQANLSAAVEEAFGQFRRSFLANKQFVGPCTTQVELCLLTCHDQEFVERCIGKACSENHMEILKKIQIVTIDQAEEIASQLEKSMDTQEDDEGLVNDSVNDYFELMKVSSECVELEYVFKSWLVDCGADDVQLTISLNTKQGKGMTLKCDINERLMNPFMNPNCQQKLFQASVQQTACPHCVPPRASTVPVCHFKVVHLIKTNGVCESVIYGQPLIVRPTSCWKLDWEDLDVNQQQFQATRTFLLQQEMCMLLESIESQPSSTKTFCILLPSESCGMLLKCVADNDILLPLANSLCIQKQSDSVQKEVDSVLLELPTSNLLNPLSFKTGIAENLLSVLQASDAKKKSTAVKRTAYGQRTQPQTARSGAKQKNVEKQDCFEYSPYSSHEPKRITQNNQPAKKARAPYKPQPNKGSIFVRNVPEFPNDF